MKRIALVALLLLAGVGGLCTAWYVSSQRALDAEVRVLEQRAAQTAVEKERQVAESLSGRLEQLRRDESQRPYFQYQNLYHDPKGASEGLSVVPSPLAAGPSHPLIAAHFQIDARGRVTLPTINEELHELNAPDAAAQLRIRDALAPAAAGIRAAATPLITTLEKEVATAARIAALEARLAARDLPPVPAEPKLAQLTRKIAVKQEAIDPSAFQQNVDSNEVFRELKNNSRQAPRPQRAIAPAAPPVQIASTDLQWQTIEVGGKPRLAALRAVITPAGTLVQGLLTPALEGMTLARGGTPLEGTGWRVHLDPVETAASLRIQHMRDRTRFQRTFVAVCALLLAVVAAVVWVLSRVEKLATDRARFAATAAHELRTPLASLRLYSDLIAEEEDPSSRERYAREIAGQTERLGRVVANVLEVTRFERGTFALEPRPGAIGVLVEECVARLRPQMEAAQCRIELEVAGDLPEISFDPDALHHVVDNLVDNAEKFSREVPDRSIAVAVAAEGGGVNITVSDRGPGVPEHLLRDPRPYRRATSASSPAGLGLGLFLVNRIVRGHGGALRSVPRPGGGASVQVFLPAFYKP
ncbi:MAG: HAMP domain-containing sensor histidine kinase [Acidobacteriota bacterium]